jgi:hypothetical protein
VLRAGELSDNSDNFWQKRCAILLSQYYIEMLQPTRLDSTSIDTFTITRLTAVKYLIETDNISLHCLIAYQLDRLDRGK